MAKSNSKEKIINVAEEIFAEKGFDGARVDEIAKKAGVNKALIYYYFDSKDDILKSLFITLLTDVEKIFSNLYSKTYDIYDIDKVLEGMLEFIMSKKDILKIAMIETLKSKSNNTLIIEVAEIIMKKEIDDVRKLYEKKGVYFPDEEKKLLVTEFFTGVMPMINYVVFQNEFSSYFNIDIETLKKNFLQSFKQTHYAYHMRK